ncbi:DUF2917 domain-containing protein [Paraburkholderia bannensis]|uniref:DUF2917 domain-containing protein n=1 Tax=Paraburkholderia bannensis TaxID=765414 RepID=UPI002AC31370|nr:DUF2917 domain-containing protein [Paraburkholderia bannensis]
MDQASQQDAAGACPAFSFDRLPADTALPAQSIHFTVPAGQTLSWRIAADSTVRVHGSRIWLTRARSPYDHWLNPGETLRVARGERLWLSSDPAWDAPPNTARVTITCAWRPPLAGARRVMELCAALFSLRTLRMLRTLLAPRNSR